MTNLTSNHDDLSDFNSRTFEFNAVEKRVYVAGTGPAVIVMTEMPGISPSVARFARWVVAAGFTVYMPSLFGQDGAVPSADEGVAIFKRACISAEFRALVANESSPITRWLMLLAKQAHTECRGTGVGAIGMCFTGNFALTMMLEPSVIAPVLMQPSLPLNSSAELEISPDDLNAVKKRLSVENLQVLAFRFEGDRICRKERFARYEQELGNRFVGRTLSDSAANTEVDPFFKAHLNYPHSVVTQHLIDADGEPTIAARDEILAFFANKLRSL